MSISMAGWTALFGGVVICATEDYQFHIVDLSINDAGAFSSSSGSNGSLTSSPTLLPANPTMKCHGLSSPPDGRTLFVLEGIKVSYDHLKCRDPTSLVVYVVNDLQQVVKDLQEAPTMGQSLITLETYK